MNATTVSYRPRQRWLLACAFIGAIGLHLIAVAVAAGYSRPIPNFQPCAFDQAIEVMPEVPPKPEAIEPPPPLAAPSDAEEENVAPVVPRTRVAMPIARRAHSAAATSLSAKALALSAPRPAYPYEARRQRITGSGVALLRIDPTTGRVTEVTMVQSTGSSILDAATVSGLRQWSFRPGTPPSVRVPITFTLTGVSY